MADAIVPIETEGRRVVLVHDWLTGMRGGEKVLDVCCGLFPEADLLTLVHVPGRTSHRIEQRRIRTSFVQHLPRPDRFYRHYLPCFPAAVEAFDLDDVDLVVSTSHCAAKAVVPTGRARQVCYCHSPMRYGWDQFEAYFGRDRIGRPGEAIARRLMAALARWDRDTAGRVSHFVANSAFVADRIARYCRRVASVLPPPVDTQYFTPGEEPPQPYFLVVSALVPYKRLDVVIGAANRLRTPLRIVGTGPDLARLQAQAGDHVEFLGSVDAATLRDLYRQATALVLPAEEDFGIAPVESMACGRPVVALGRGGARETVVPGVTGLLVDSPDAETFAGAMDEAARMRVDAAALSAHADQFSTERFTARLRDLLTTALDQVPAC